MNEDEAEISRPEKILFPGSKIDKKDVADYYHKVSKFMLPFMKDRPLALERYPDGIKDEGFYQKNASDYFPSYIKTQKIDQTTYVIVNDKKSLLYLINQAVITFHGWMSTIDSINKPDKIVLDIDPPDSLKLEDVKAGAEYIKKILEHIGLEPYLMSTGIKGLHIVSPIKPELNFKEVKQFTRRLAELTVNSSPERFTIEQRKDKRENKIFIDHLRNERAQLSVIPYSLRPIENAPIAVPLKWKELKSFRHQNYILKHASRLKDSWKDFNKKRKSLKSAIKKFDKLY